MERIRLSRQEKKVLRGLYKYGNKAIEDFKPREVARCIRSLQRKGLAKGAFVEGGLLEAARLTGDGEYYIRNNPKLLNPINWANISAVVAVLALFVAIAALLVGWSDF